MMSCFKSKTKESRPKLGDVVRIKSGGGPLMTIGIKCTSGLHYCKWWDDRLKMFIFELFHPDQLELVERKSNE